MDQATVEFVNVASSQGLSPLGTKIRCRETGGSGNPASPIGVIDQALSLFSQETLNQDYDWESCSRELFDSVRKLDLSSQTSDTDSLSSVSMDDQGETNSCQDKSYRRSIFKGYWEKKNVSTSSYSEGTVPLKEFVVFSMDSRTVSTSNFSSSSSVQSENTYERSLHGTNQSLLSSVPNRRNIFSKCCHSQSLPSFSIRHGTAQRSHSTSALGKKPLRSCFRKNIEAHHVSFQAEIKVVVFDKPQEGWAAPGWSEYFF